MEQKQIHSLSIENTSVNDLYEIENSFYMSIADKWFELSLSPLSVLLINESGRQQNAHGRARVLRLQHPLCLQCLQKNEEFHPLKGGLRQP